MPDGAVTVAVLVIEPTVVAVPVTVTITVFPVPAVIVPVVMLILEPVPDEVEPQLALPVTVQFHETLVMLEGTVSAITAPVTLFEPAGLVTVIVYETPAPALTVEVPVFVIPRLTLIAAAVIVVLLEAESLLAVVSV